MSSCITEKIQFSRLPFVEVSSWRILSLHRSLNSKSPYSRSPKISLNPHDFNCKPLCQQIFWEQFWNQFSSLDCLYLWPLGNNIFNGKNLFSLFLSQYSIFSSLTRSFQFAIIFCISPDYLCFLHPSFSTSPLFGMIKISLKYLVFLHSLHLFKSKLFSKFKAGASHYCILHKSLPHLSSPQ
jgi:hypothetical protein